MPVKYRIEKGEYTRTPKPVLVLNRFRDSRVWGTEKMACFIGTISTGRTQSRTCSRYAEARKRLH